MIKGVKEYNERLVFGKRIERIVDLGCPSFLLVRNLLTMLKDLLRLSPTFITDDKFFIKSFVLFDYNFMM